MKLNRTAFLFGPGRLAEISADFQNLPPKFLETVELTATGRHNDGRAARDGDAREAVLSSQLISRQQATSSRANPMNIYVA